MNDQQTAVVPNHNGPWRELPLANGLVVKIHAVSPILIQKVSARYQSPKRPTYEAQTVGGNVELHPMDEQSARETPGGLAVWKNYLEEKERAESQQNAAVTQFILAKGTKMDQLPDDGWEEMQELFGVEIPTNPDLRRAHYLSTELGPDEMKYLIEQIMALSGVSQTAIDEAENSFRPQA